MEHEFNKLRSSNAVSVRVKSVGDWWEADPESKLFRLAERALAREWSMQPLFVREGGTMPVSTHTLFWFQSCGCREDVHSDPAKHLALVSALALPYIA